MDLPSIPVFLGHSVKTASEGPGVLGWGAQAGGLDWRRCFLRDEAGRGEGVIGGECSFPSRGCAIR